MSEPVALWELEVEVAKAPSGSYRISGTLWKAPSYPLISTGSRSVQTRFPSEETSEPIAAVSALWRHASLDMPEVAGAFLRLTLELPPELERLDWETALPAALVVRRRFATLLGRHARRADLRLPLSVCLVDPTGSVATAIYRDPHLAVVRDVGLQIASEQASPEAAIVHLVAAGGDVLSGLEARLKARSRPALLVVVQSQAPISEEVATLVSRTNLLVVIGTDSTDLVRNFYRALLHDTPIDRSLALALQASGARRYRLWADGDVRLPLLSRAILEAVRDRPSGDLWGTTRGIDPRTSERVIRDRVDAVTTDLRRRLDALSAPLEFAIDAGLQSIRDRTIDFRNEDHGVRAVANLQRQIEATAQLALARRSLNAPRGDIRQAVARVTSLRLRPPHGPGDLPKTQPLVCGHPYRLVVRIGHQAAAQARATAEFPEDLLKSVFRDHDTAELDVVVFAPADDFELPSPPRLKLHLPRVGDAEAGLPFRVLRSGVRRLRVAVYHGARLLQSLCLVARVVGADEEVADADQPAVQVGLDYSATGDFALLESLPSPTASIVVNDGPGGTHWLGVFAPEAGESAAGHIGQLFTVSDEKVRKVVGALQNALENAAVFGRGYRFADDTVDDVRWKQREATVVALARAGKRMWRTLLGDSLQPAFRLSERPGVLSVGRCRTDGVGIPWAACYDYDLDPAQPAAGQSVCSTFSKQARAGQDWLDDPAGCRAQADCPLNIPGAEKSVVCPFGFWGIRHQIEQPLHAVPATTTSPKGQAELGEVETVAHGSMDFNGRIRVACGRFQFADAETHPEELKPALDVNVASRLSDVIALIEKDGTSLIYFFCHGDTVEGDFVLQVGSAAAVENIGPDTLGTRFKWTQPQPLVFLNGCDTVAFNAEAINELTAAFRRWGAAGVIGSEFAVPRPLARTVGADILRRLAGGEMVGQAFLAVRRTLFRKMNPLALAYSAYASAWLHYAPTPACAQCRAVTASR